MLNEPVRGVSPDPGLFSLSGVERLRFYQRSQLPATPHNRLFGYRLTQVSLGTTVLSQPLTPWSDMYDGWVDLSATAALSAYVTASTACPAGVYPRMVTLSFRNLRPITIDDGSVIARGRLLHAGTAFTTVEILMEDPLGRAVAHATASAVNVPISPPPPDWSPPSEDVGDEPSYASPDPVLRPLPRNFEQPELTPAAALIGVRLDELTATTAKASLAASRWFTLLRDEIEPGILASFQSHTAMQVVRQFAEEQRALTFELAMSFLRSVPADGRVVRSQASLGDQAGDLFVVEGRTEDADGQLVSTLRGTLQKRPPRAKHHTPSNRVLLTVLFTDLVGSTAHAGAVGDQEWKALLEEHHTLIRRQIELHLGREVKTTGDGFLATFDSPSRAVHCARAIRTAVEKIGLEVRAGLHTGECELMGNDVAGLAVHVASRVESSAAPGEILVSHTVKDLAAGSGLTFDDRGTHELKGVDGAWQLFALAD